MKNKAIKILTLIIISLFVLTIGVKAATTIAASLVTYNGTTVQAALDELIAIAIQCPDDALCSKVKLGDYVSMTPTQTTYTIPTALTGYSSDQTINPSELNLWRVIAINSDGTIDMVSEYVSSTNVYFSGQEGYLNFVGTLNTIANQYGNSKYTIRTRHMGYNGQTATITDTSKFTTTASLTSSTSNNDNETVGGGDVMYEKDIELVKVALGTVVAKKPSNVATNYWLASRAFEYTSADIYSWRGRNVYDSGSVSTIALYSYSNDWDSRTYWRAVRPIVTLKSDITATSGNGSSGSPWILS